MKKRELKGWLLAGTFTVTLWAVLAALFYYLDDLIAAVFVVLLFITLSSIMVSAFYFLEKKRIKQSRKQHALNQLNQER